MALKTKELRHLISRSRASEFVLKVVGREEYLLDPAPLTQYKVGRECYITLLLYTRVSIAISTLAISTPSRN